MIGLTKEHPKLESSWISRIDYISMYKEDHSFFITIG